MACTCKKPADRSARRHLLAVLREEPQTLGQLRDRVADVFGCGFAPGTFHDALHAMMDEGLTERLDLGPGRPQLWSRTPPQMKLVRACWARNRPAQSARVHMAFVDTDRTYCGLLAGESAAPGERVTCQHCADLDAAATGMPPWQQQPTTPEEAVIREAEAALSGPLMALLQPAEGLTCWLLWFPFSPLLLSVIRGIPGARWDKDRKCWLVPNSMVAETQNRLRAASVEVRLEPTNPAYAWWVALMSLGPALRFTAYTRLCQALPAGTPERDDLDAAWEHLASKP